MVEYWVYQEGAQVLNDKDCPPSDLRTQVLDVQSDLLGVLGDTSCSGDGYLGVQGYVLPILRGSQVLDGDAQTMHADVAVGLGYKLNKGQGRLLNVQLIRREAAKALGAWNYLDCYHFIGSGAL